MNTRPSVTLAVALVLLLGQALLWFKAQELSMRASGSAFPWMLVVSLATLLLLVGLTLYHGHADRQRARLQQISSDFEELRRAHAQIQADLEAAARLQRTLLPQQAPEVPGIEFAWAYQACRQVGGDMFNIVRLDEHHVGIYVLDVVGKGVPAALLSVSLYHLLSPLPRPGGLLKRPARRPPFYELVRPAQVARELNRIFLSRRSENPIFFTFFYGILDLRTCHFTFVRAGHPGPVQISGQSSRIWDEGGGPVIGVVEGAEFVEETMALHPGDQVVLYTDGATDARNREGKRFGTLRMAGILAGHRGQGIKATVETLRGTLEAFSSKQYDDVTIVAFAVRSGGGCSEGEAVPGSSGEARRAWRRRPPAAASAKDQGAAG